MHYVTFGEFEQNFAPKFFNYAEEQALFRLMREEGCRNSRKRLIESVLPLAIRLVNKHAHKFRESQRDELSSAACEACMSAVDRFDMDRGVRLATTVGFAVQAAVNVMPLDGAVHLISRQQQTSEYLDVHRKTKYIGNAKEDTNGEEYLGLVSSFDTPEQETENRERDNGIAAALNNLPAREASVLRRRVWDGMTLKQIAEQDGLSRERIRQLETRAYEHLKEILCMSPYEVNVS